MIGLVVGLLAAGLAAGSLLVAAALVLRHPELPLSFLRFVVAGAALAAALAALVGGAPIGTLRLGLAVVALVVYALLRGGASPRPVWLAVGLLAAAALCAEALVPLPTPGGRTSLRLVGALGSGLLLGTVHVAMILGHWYLVAPGLSIAPLRDAAAGFALALAWRWAGLLAALAAGGWAALGVARPADLVFSTTALFFSFRVLTGLAAPVLLAGLVWQTVKIRSTQSATGLLYVAVFVVLFGELVAQFLAAVTGYPL